MKKHITDIKALPTGVICVHFKLKTTIEIETFRSWEDFLYKYPNLYVEVYKHNVWGSKVKEFLSRVFIFGGFILFLIWFYMTHGI